MFYLMHMNIMRFQLGIMKKLLTGEKIGLCDYIFIYIWYNNFVICVYSELARNCKIKLDSSTFDSPYTKTHLLFQAHFLRLVLPCTDYYTDLKSILDQAIRILQV